MGGDVVGGDDGVFVDGVNQRQQVNEKENAGVPSAGDWRPEPSGQRKCQDEEADLQIQAKDIGVGAADKQLLKARDSRQKSRILIVQKIEG